MDKTVLNTTTFQKGAKRFKPFAGSTIAYLEGGRLNSWNNNIQL
jgi:hypothetical protein